jgi:hypothetical protein
MVQALIKYRPLHQERILKSIKIAPSSFAFYYNKIIKEINQSRSKYIGIANEIFLSSDLSVKNVEWVQLWTDLCINYFDRLNVFKCSFKETIDLLLKSISFQINRQLGLHKEQIAILKSSIEYSLSDLFFDKNFERQLFEVGEKLIS